MTDRARVLDAVTEAIGTFNASHPEARLDPSESTVLYGASSALDSLSLVALVVEIEDALVRTIGLEGALSDERAFSAKSSPFRTVGTLVDYVTALAT